MLDTNPPVYQYPDNWYAEKEEYPMIRCKFTEGSCVPVPRRATQDSAGFDLSFNGTEPYTLNPMEFKMLSTGVCVAIPKGYVGLFVSRSGLAAKHGLFVLNAPGIIDADYRGEIKNILANFGSSPYTLQPGERFAQLVVVPYSFANQMSMVEVLDLDNTSRGTGGFGSTGTK